jgi:hypothetical protein
LLLPALASEATLTSPDTTSKVPAEISIDRLV